MEEKMAVGLIVDGREDGGCPNCVDGREDGMVVLMITKNRF